MLSAAGSTSSTAPPPPQRIEALRVAIAAEQELRRRRRAWQPTFRGASLQVQETTAPEWMSCGPAESAKTWGICWRLINFALETPGGIGVLGRRVRNDMTISVLRTFERILDLRGIKVLKFGGERVEYYGFPNGFRYYVVGLDRPSKVLSGEVDIIYINQAEEIPLSAWETLSTRVTGRGAKTRTPMLCGDCNPGPPNHWILRRPSLVRFYAKHEDNPTLFDDDGNLTEQGKRTLSRLDALTGVRLKRLRYGQWVAAEGVVYEGFSRDLHLVKRPEKGIPSTWRRVAAIDFGFTNPFAYVEGAVDPDGRIWIDLQFYGVGRLVEDWARLILATRKEMGLPPLEALVCDHDSEDAATLRKHGLPNQRAVKEIENGIQKVAARLRPAGDGRPRLLVLEDSLFERDPELEEGRRACGLVEEMEIYRFPDGKDGKPAKEKPLDIDNHAADATRYLVEYVDGRKAPQLPLETRIEQRVAEVRGSEALVTTDATAVYRAVQKAVKEEEERSSFKTPVWSRGIKALRRRRT